MLRVLSIFEVFLTIWPYRIIAFVFRVRPTSVVAGNRHSSAMLSDLDLFDNPVSSAMTFLRIFTARSFMLDVDKLYDDRGVGKKRFCWSSFR